MIWDRPAECELHSAGRLSGEEEVLAEKIGNASIRKASLRRA